MAYGRMFKENLNVRLTDFIMLLEMCINCYRDVTGWVLVCARSVTVLCLRIAFSNSNVQCG